MADSDRPRPRPRPRPAKAPSLSTLPPSSPLEKRVEAKDDDEMFMRNRKRTNKTWEQLGALSKETAVLLVESDGEDGASSRPRKQKKKPDAPRWQKNKDLVRLLSAELSDDSDNGIEIIGESTNSGGKYAAKRKRSRSRSITPPPALPLQQLQNARNIVRQVLDYDPRPHSPIQLDADDSTDTIILDPELALIAQSIKSQARLSQVLPRPASYSETDDTVTLSVKWRPHPLNEAGKEDLWMFKMSRNDNFRDLFEATAEEASILSENLIMSFNGKRVFSSVTPTTLKIWNEAELVACDKTTYEYLHNHSVAVPGFPSTRDGSPTLISDTEEASPSESVQDSGAESDGDSDTLKLILRSAISKDITLTVRPTTKCGAIVKAFLKKAGVAEKYPGIFDAPDARKSGAVKDRRKGSGGQAGNDPKLSIDGDKMGDDVEIGDADLEDGDLVEVVGL